MQPMKIKEAFARPSARGLTLTKTRNLKMSRSAHAYVRGNTVKFYEWLEGQKSGSLPDGPAEHERAYLEHCRRYALEADK
jgi:uncharacterized protein DUF2252